MTTDFTTGSVVADFRIESVIGVGAMGTVYLATDTSRGGQVALKLLAPELARDERFRQRFVRESQLAASLDHPNIVPTIAAGERDGVLYLAMAYIEGTDLRELLRTGRLEPERALDVIAQTADALDAAHAAGLVHRDVKPANILVATNSGDEHAYVCDFGLARHVSSVSSLTGERGFVGTIDYVPPEQIEGGPIDHRADVYALGCVLYECLAGARPFDRESELSVVFAHLNEPPPSLSDLRPELPETFDPVFRTALAKSPEERYTSCGELVEAARAALQGKTFARRSSHRRRWALGVAAVVGAAAAAIGGIVATRGEAAHAITETSIGGAGLGLRQAGYEQLFGAPWHKTLLENSGHTKVAFPKQKVAVYFKGLTDTAVEVTTWNKTYKTAEGVGPCSSIAQLKKAYGTRLKPSPLNTLGGKVYAYVVGRSLIFAAPGPDPTPGPSKHVTAVALYYGDAPAANKQNGALPFAAFIAMSETRCRTG
jgi:predicted Ser/Thr protein kinase